jgi:predicted ArsR family transcriptional regulator
MKTDIGDLREKILSEARSRIPLPPQEDEITANMMAEAEGCTAKQARSILKDMEEEGVVTVRYNGLEGGKTCKVYKAI